MAVITQCLGTGNWKIINRSSRHWEIFDELTVRLSHKSGKLQFLLLLLEILFLQVHLRSAGKLKDLCCKNKGAFIKVGQHVGSLDYLLPSEYVETMRSLFRDAPQTPFDDILSVLREDLQQSVLSCV